MTQCELADSVDGRTLWGVTAEPVSRHERKERTRRALLDAALSLLADRGFAGLSLREVTKLAGIVPTAFYRHFASMEELGIALVEESMRSLRTMIREARTGLASSGDVIRASVRTLAQHVRAHEDHFRFLTRERYGGGGAVGQAIAVELKLLSRELAVDLARFDELRSWTNEDLQMLADLVVTTMLTTVFELLETRSGDARADDELVRTAEKRLRLIVLGVPQWKSH